MRAVAAVVGLALLGCTGVVGASSATATLTLTGGTPGSVDALVKSVSGADPRTRVTPTAGEGQWTLVIEVEAGSEADAVRACTERVEAALRQQLEAHRAEVAARRSELSDEIGQTDDASKKAELRRSIEDLAAQRDRNDLVVTSPCAVRAT